MSSPVCQKLEEIRAELARLTQATRDIQNTCDGAHDLAHRVQALARTMDQFYVVLGRGGQAKCSFGPPVCFLGYEPCPNNPTLCVNNSPLMDKSVRKEACATQHSPGDVFMLSAREAFPNTNASTVRFPVAYATNPQLNSPQRVQEHLERNLKPGESIFPKII